MSWSARDVRVAFGEVVALDGVSIELVRGQVHAVVGGDGAGKSTLLRVLCGLDVGQTGTLRLPPSRRVGVVPAVGGVHRDLTVQENVDFVAGVHGVDGRGERADTLLRRAGLDTFRDRLAGPLSGGQRRKLAGVMALLHAPDLLVLDEVTTGVDPVSRMELWRMVATAAADGAAVVAATTYLDEAERAGVVTLLQAGRVLASGSPRQVVDRVPGSVVAVDRPVDPSLAWRHGPRWREWRPDLAAEDEVTLEDAAIVFELAAERGER